MAKVNSPNLTAVTINSAGTGPFALGAAAEGYFGVEKLIDGATYSYSVQQVANCEAGYGLYAAATRTLTRTVIVSTHGNGPVPFQAGAVCEFTVLKEDLDASGVGAIPEAPTDGQTYGRRSATWAALALLGEAPIDANYYTRHQGGWAVGPGGIADAPSDGREYVRKNGAWFAVSAPPAPGGFGPSTAAVRGSTQSANTSSGFTIALPAGSLAGDTAILYATGGYAPSAPSGWAQLDAQGGVWNGAIYMRTLTAPDIVAGSVTVAYSGNYNSLGELIVLKGALSVRTIQAIGQIGAATPIVITTDATPIAGDVVVLFGSMRSTGHLVPPASTSVLQNFGSAGAEQFGFGGAYAAVVSGAGALSASFAYTITAVDGNPGAYSAIVVLHA